MKIARGLGIAPDAGYETDSCTGTTLHPMGCDADNEGEDAAGNGGAGQGAPAGPPGASQDQGGGGAPRVHQIPENAFRALKDRERTAGRQEALAEIENAAREAGFGSLKDAFSAVAAFKQGGAGGGNPRPAASAPAPTQVQPAASATGQPGAVRSARLAMALDEGRRAMKTKLDLETARRKAAEQTAAAETARNTLSLCAVKAGAADVDYAVSLAARHVAGLSDAEVAKFDPDTWFVELRGKRPALFNETVQPATTGGAVDGGAPAPVKPGAVQQASASKNVDVRQLKPQEYAEHLRRRGLRLPGHGAPM